MTSKERREKGQLFIADDNDWVEMKRARRLTQMLNTEDRSDFEKIRSIINELFGRSDETTFVNPPFYCDYGSNIEVVTKDIPDWTVAAGNPCKVIRQITEEDKNYYFKDRMIDDEIQKILSEK